MRARRHPAASITSGSSRVPPHAGTWGTATKVGRLRHPAVASDGDELLLAPSFTLRACGTRGRGDPGWGGRAGGVGEQPQPRGERGAARPCPAEKRAGLAMLTHLPWGKAGD